MKDVFNTKAIEMITSWKAFTLKGYTKGSSNLEKVWAN